MKKKNEKIIVCTIIFSIIMLVMGTVAYFIRSVSVDIAGVTGNLVLIVNEKNAVENETFSVSLNRSVEEPYVMPDDKGVFNINIDSTGSTSDVDVTVSISRINLPDNLKFYLDSNYKDELTVRTYMIKKSNNMTKTVPVYWYWDGSKDDEDDTTFIGQELFANVSVSATTHTLTFSEKLVASAKSNLDTNVDFGSVFSDTNGVGLMMRDGTQNDEFPIVYYRGDVTNNNVIFSNKCWLIVRTTETGGVKLVYNGPVVKKADGSETCTNYSGVGGGEAYTAYGNVYTTTDGSSYNLNGCTSPVCVGYMYNDVSYIYDKTTLPTEYLKHLSDETIDPESGRNNQNLKDSRAKIVIDDWYEENILGKQGASLLEDTVWCNDRSRIPNAPYSIENFGQNVYMFAYAPTVRLQYNKNKTGVIPSLECSREVDRFTVSRSNGNGDLDYPIGLLTADEIVLAGHAVNEDIKTYLALRSGSCQWVLSPYFYDESYPEVFSINNSKLYFKPYNSDCGARPSISLSFFARVNEGDGSFNNPYIVE